MEVEAGCQGGKGVGHGCEHNAWNGGASGIEQRAHLEPGTSDVEEVVRSWADTMPTLPRSLVQDWKVLPGMAAPSEMASVTAVISYLD